MKKQVVHICNLGMNGKAIFVCNLLEHTDFTQCDVTVINYRAEDAEPIHKRLRKLPVTIVNPAEKGNKAFVALLDDYFTHHHVDIVHSHIWDLSGLFLRVARKNGVPVRVCHSHNTSKAAGRYNFVKEFARDRVVWNILKKMIQHNANRFVACSEEAAKWLFIQPIVRGVLRYC